MILNLSQSYSKSGWYLVTSQIKWDLRVRHKTLFFLTISLKIQIFYVDEITDVYCSTHNFKLLWKCHIVPEWIYVFNVSWVRVFKIVFQFKTMIIVDFFSSGPIRSCADLWRFHSHLNWAWRLEWKILAWISRTQIKGKLNLTTLSVETTFFKCWHSLGFTL